MDIDELEPFLTCFVQPLFGLGCICATPNAINAIPRQEIQDALKRHASGDWGALDQEDWQRNEEAIESGLRILSIYSRADGNGRFWIITQADRSVTTVLLPSDY